jgi:hypothetical protein
MTVGKSCCGRCCAVIVRARPIGTEYWYPLALEKVQSYEEGFLDESVFGEDDMVAMVANFWQITFEDARKLNPDLTESEVKGRCLYTCKQYDAERKECRLESMGFKMPEMCKKQHAGSLTFYPPWCTRRDITWV